MPESQPSLVWRRAALRLEATLRELTGQAPERLDARTLQNCYPGRSWIEAGWRLSIIFSDGVTRRIDVVATNLFPTIPVRTALVDHPEFMTWPHVESDGILCLLPNLAECDPDDPWAVATNLLDRSIRLVEELLDGTIVERDFREEFLTYWAYKAHGNGAHIFSLLDPAPPSRIAKVWRGNGLEVIGEDGPSLQRWVRNRFGDIRLGKVEDATFLWMDEPPLPAAYPETGSDLLALAASIGREAVEALEALAASEPASLRVIIGAPGRGGPGLIGVKVPNPRSLKGNSRSARVPVSKGFRPGRTPRSVLVGRWFGGGPVIRNSVERADAAWVHGRGRDLRTARLLGATIIIVGCGSVGAPIACALAQAGVGRIILVDPDSLSWPNVGRHPLGASAVGRNKAEALAERLRADYPHLQVEHRPCGMHELLESEGELLEGADLIVSATGSWVAENALNRWHVEHGRNRPILYAWTEAHACAGHGVVITIDGGCLQCHINRTGEPSFKVVEWPSGGDTSFEEPACGAHYQPYGPIELGFVTAMIGELALDCLLTMPALSFSRIYAAPEDRLAKFGGRLSDLFLSEYGKGNEGMRIIERVWMPTDCAACGSGRVAAA